jgi:hypothetical protein
MATRTLPKRWASSKAFAGAGSIGQVFPDELAFRVTVHVEVLGHNQFGGVDRRTIQNGSLQGRELLHPLVIFRLGTLVDHRRPFDGGTGKVRVVGIPANNLHLGRHIRRALAGAVDHSDGFAALEQGAHGCLRQGTGSEDNVKFSHS